MLLFIGLIKILVMLLQILVDLGLDSLFLAAAEDPSLDKGRNTVPDEKPCKNCHDEDYNNKSLVHGYTSGSGIDFMPLSLS